MNYADILSPGATSQIERAAPEQVKNNADGFVFQVDRWTRLDRFLILGSDAPTYYETARALTKENAASLTECWSADPRRTASRIAEISLAGRAPKNDPAIFALALGAVHADLVARSSALAQLQKVCRTATHLFQFVDQVRKLGRGWGRGLKRAVAAWYDSMPVDRLAYQGIKYRNREGYSHRRLLQSAHPTGGAISAPGEVNDRAYVYEFMTGKQPDAEGKISTLMHPTILAHLKAMDPATSRDELIGLITQHKLPWEAIPTEAKKDADVWLAMLPSMGLTALIRNLAAMTAVGAIAPLSVGAVVAVQKLGDLAALRHDRIHPFNVLQALAVYKSGRGVRGSLSWEPVPAIVDALERAFYASFAFVEPTGKRTLIGVDVSASMTTANIGGSALTAAEGAAALAMTTLRSEPVAHIMAFDQGMRDLPVSASSSLSEVLRYTSNINGGGTDCALPMIEALRRGWDVDVFVVITDNETHSGRTGHPFEALRRYREARRIPAKLIVVGMTSTGFSIADPRDAGMLDMVGFDSNGPAIMADFARQ